MPMHASVTLRDLALDTRIGTYGPGDVVPDSHVLDLVLTIDPALVLIDRDSMDAVFDYDPLVVRIRDLARAGPYATQERLIARIVASCAEFAQIGAVDITLRKSPVLGGSGALGLRLVVDADALDALRRARH